MKRKKSAILRKIDLAETMWLFVLFDIPRTTKKQRFYASQFRQRLLSRGFTMMQFSVYIRHCGTTAYTDTIARFVMHSVPPAGKVSIIRIKDKQFGKIQTFHKAKKSEIEAPRQRQLALL